VELFGILCSVPAAFVASAIYFFVVRWLLRGLPKLRAVLIPGSTLVLVALAIEWILLGTIGVVRSRAIIGPSFYPLHLALFVLSVPALANLLIVRKASRDSAWAEVAIFCTMLALPVVLIQYAVAEALYGIDGAGGPYGAQ
jgi:hypothetical protein